ncbi:hypothetical protein CTAYLR_003049 [Chrysophaeum taylorii]|uniref:Fe2OG dioxygenase domain-containing protein n=1 Tax=Chrysophaeum taylorii TaxID=2483200 RepID=A0AAD7U7G8_9STRA|nr:hypothetical protein CTAYLR_003049 [Chrysophaeum taylorii]
MRVWVLCEVLKLAWGEVAALRRVSVRAYREGSDAERGEAIAQLKASMEGQGMALVVEHGVPSAVIEECVRTSRLFFGLDEKTKSTLEFVGGDNDLPPRSYAAIGTPRGRAYSVQQRSADDQIVNEWLQFKDTSFEADPFDPYYTSPEGREFYTFAEPPAWPPGLDAEGATRNYYGEMEKLVDTMYEMLAVALGLETDIFKPRHAPNWPVTAAHYPPLADGSRAPPRIGPHYDRTVFSLVKVDEQDDEGKGGNLQVLLNPRTHNAADGRDADPTWYDVVAPESAIVLNSGEMLRRWSNGKFRRVVHRVGNPTGVQTRGRLSLMVYASPDYDQRVRNPYEDETPEFPASTVGEMFNWGSSLPTYNATLQDEMRRAQALYTVAGDQFEHEALPMATIDVVDVGALLSTDDDDDDKARGAAEALSAAFERTGFCVVVGHDVRQSTLDDLRRGAYEFFGSEEKHDYDHGKGYGFGGYVRYRESGAQLLGDFSKPTDLVESLTVKGFTDEACEDPVFGRATDVPRWMAPAAALFLNESRSLGRALARAMRLSLDVPEAELDLVLDVDNKSGLRLAYYPDVPNPEPGRMRYGAHVDSGTFTVLALDPANPEGLQVQLKDYSWLDVPHVSGGLVVNVGALLSRWTAKKWRASVHRVLPKPGDRLSIVTSALGARSDGPPFAAFSSLERGDRRPLDPVQARHFLAERVALHRPEFAEETGLKTPEDFKQETARIINLHK